MLWHGRSLSLIHISGDGDSRFLIAPDWTRAKRGVLGAIDRYLRDHSLYEGDLFNPNKGFACHLSNE